MLRLTLPCLLLALGAAPLLTAQPAAEPPADQAPRLVVVSIVKDSLVLIREVPVAREITREVEVIVDGRKEKRLVRQVVTSMVKVAETRELKGVRFLDTAGKEVDLATVRKRLATPTVVAKSLDGRPVAPTYLRALAKDALIMLLPARPVPPPGKPLPPDVLPKKG